MSFIAYVIAWAIICVILFALYAVFVRIKNLILRKTPLGDYCRKQEEEHYRKIASYVADELKKG